MISWCPNNPRCEHPTWVHDVEDMEDLQPRCCADGCDCGRKPAATPSARLLDV